MSTPFQPSCHSLHPVPPCKKRCNGVLLVFCILGGCLILAGAWGWYALEKYRAEQQADTLRQDALLEAKARKDAALLAEIGRKQEETSGKRSATAPEQPAPGWRDEEVTAKGQTPQ